MIKNLENVAGPFLAVLNNKPCLLRLTYLKVVQSKINQKKYNLILLDYVPSF